MQLRDWLKASNVSIKSFSEEIRVERAMVYRYFTGAMPRANTIRRIELLTDGAVTAQDFYDNALEHRNGGEKQPREQELSAPAQQTSRGDPGDLSADPVVSTTCATPHASAWPDLSAQNISAVPAERGAHGSVRTDSDPNRPRISVGVLGAAITSYILTPTEMPLITPGSSMAKLTR